MDTWKSIEIQRIADVFLGKTPARIAYRSEGTHKVIKFRDLKAGYIDFETAKDGFIDSDDSTNGYRELHVGDVLITSAAHSGENIGKKCALVTYIPDKFERIIFTGELLNIRTPNPILGKWVFYFFRSVDGFKELQNAVSGVHLTSGRAKLMEIPLAPHNEQERVVEKLEKLFGKVEAAQERLDKIPAILKRFRQSVLAAACSGKLTADWRNSAGTKISVSSQLKEIEGLREAKWNDLNRNKKKSYKPPESLKGNNLGDIPETWTWVSADALCFQITDGEHIQPPYQETGFPMLSAKHVRDGFVTFDNAGLISKKDFAVATARCAPENGDLLIVSVGATTGRSAIVENKPPFSIVRSVLLLKPVIEPLYLLRWTQTSWCNQWMMQASGASAQPHLYIKDTRLMPVPLPPLEEQTEIVRRVENLFKFAYQVEERYKKARNYTDKLTQSILAKAFRGELAPQNPNDEPASALLERIKITVKNKYGKNTR